MPGTTATGTGLPSNFGSQENSGDLTWGQSGRGSDELSVPEAAAEFFSQYARERPEVVAMWAFGVGFILGWKLKPW